MTFIHAAYYNYVMDPSRKVAARFLAGGLLFALLVSAAPGCGKNPAPAETIPPADYQTFADAYGLFDISFPPDWVPAVSDIGIWDEAAREIISSFGSGDPVQTSHIVFYAGIATETGFLPSVNIVVQGLLKPYSLDELTEAEIRGYGIIYGDFSQLSLTKTVVDGREAAIVEFEATPPHADRRHYIQMFVLERNFVWVVGCASAPDEAARWEKDFQSIIRSLHIYK